MKNDEMLGVKGGGGPRAAGGLVVTSVTIRSVKVKTRRILEGNDEMSGMRGVGQPEDLSEVERMFRAERGGGNYGAGTKEKQAANYAAAKQREKERLELFELGLSKFKKNDIQGVPLLLPPSDPAPPSSVTPRPPSLRRNQPSLPPSEPALPPSVGPRPPSLRRNPPSLPPSDPALPPSAGTRSPIQSRCLPALCRSSALCSRIDRCVPGLGHFGRAGLPCPVCR
jgi:hypothetical protein